MFRVVRAVLLVLVMGLLGACTTAGSTDPGCGECVEELAAVRAEIEALPDVKKLRTLRMYPASPTNGATVDLELSSRSAGDSGLADEVAKIVWQSELTPVDVVTVSILDSSGALVPLLPYDFRDDSPDYDSYADRWGPRPVTSS